MLKSILGACAGLALLCAVAPAKAYDDHYPSTYPHMQQLAHAAKAVNVKVARAAKAKHRHGGKTAVIMRGVGGVIGAVTAR